jgi:hypothetical protein
MTVSAKLKERGIDRQNTSRDGSNGYFLMRMLSWLSKKRSGAACAFKARREFLTPESSGHLRVVPTTFNEPIRF